MSDAARLLAGVLAGACFYAAGYLAYCLWESFKR